MSWRGPRWIPWLALWLAALALPVAAAPVLNDRLAAWPAGASQQALQRLYGAADARPAWLDDAGRPNALAREALGLLADAALDGLDPRDYAVAPPMEAATPQQAADWELALSDSLLRYLRHLHRGRAAPRDVGFRVAPPDDPVHDPALLLRAALDAGRLGRALEAARPPLAQYRQLRAALVRYRELPADMAPLPGGPTVKPGQAWAGTEALRQRLVAFGDLDANADANGAPATEPALYDGPLVDALRRFQERHGLEADGAIGKATLAALNVPVAQRVRQLELALERLRWLPHPSGSRFIAINIPMFRLWAWDAGAAEEAPALHMRVIVGKAMRTQTPVFSEEMRYLIFRPYWNVPRSILRDELLPAIERDPSYLQRHEMEIVQGQGDDARAIGLSAQSLQGLREGVLRVRQRPGARNSLGLVKFIFPNDANVYLHGTPAQRLFERSRRDFSHGCVRLEDPVALAEWLLRDEPGWTRERILEAMAAEESQQVNLFEPVPVLLFYLSAAVAPEDGRLLFAEDIYGHDRALERALAKLRAR